MGKNQRKALKLASMNTTVQTYDHAYLDQLTYQRTIPLQARYTTSTKMKNGKMKSKVNITYSTPGKNAEDIIPLVETFLQTLEKSPKSLVILNQSKINQLINNFEAWYGAQSYSIRLALYALKTGLKKIDGMPKTNAVEWQKQYGALCGLLWDSLLIVKHSGTGGFPQQSFVSAAYHVLQEMHIGEGTKILPILGSEILVQSPFVQRELLADQFEEDEREEYKRALELFDANNCGTSLAALHVKNAILLSVEKAGVSKKKRTPDYKFHACVLNLHVYLKTSSPEALKKIQEIDPRVTNYETAKDKYIQLAYVAEGQPEHRDLAACMFIAAIILIFSALVVLGAGLGVASPFAALMISGGVSLIVGSGVGFFGRRQGVSQAMDDVKNEIKDAPPTRS